MTRTGSCIRHNGNQFLYVIIEPTVVTRLTMTVDTSSTIVKMGGELSQNTTECYLAFVGR